MSAGEGTENWEKANNGSTEPWHGFIQPKYKNDKDWVIYDNDPINGGQQIHPQDHFPFSPLPNNPMSLEGLALLGIIATFSKSERGKEQLKQIIIKYLDTCAKVIDSLASVKSFDWLTGINNNYQNMAVLHRLGLVADGDYMRVAKHYQSIFDKELTAEYVFAGLTTVETFVEGSKTSITEKIGKAGAERSRNKSGLSALAEILATKR